MKRVLSIITLTIVFVCMGTLSAFADTNTTITKVDTDNGKYYAEFNTPLDWIVIKQATGALVWINDTTEYTLEQVKEISMSKNPSLVHSVDYWGMITGYHKFSNNSDYPLPTEFNKNMWGTYWFTLEIGSNKFTVDLQNVSNVTYSYTEIVKKPEKPSKPVIIITPPLTDTPTKETPIRDYSPKTGNVDKETMWFLGLLIISGFGMWYSFNRK